MSAPRRFVCSFQVGEFLSHIRGPGGPCEIIPATGCAIHARCTLSQPASPAICRSSCRVLEVLGTRAPWPSATVYGSSVLGIFGAIGLLVGARPQRHDARLMTIVFSSHWCSSPVALDYQSNACALRCLYDLRRQSPLMSHARAKIKRCGILPERCHLGDCRMIQLETRDMAKLLLQTSLSSGLPLRLAAQVKIGDH